RTEADTPAMREAVGKALSVGELLRWMIVESDNLATNVLIKKAGGPSAVTEHARPYGLEKTTVARFIEDKLAFEAGFSSHAQPREFGHLLEKIWRGKVVSAKASQEMLAILSKCRRDWVGLRLPPEVQVAHKTGAIDGVRHDLGIVTLPSGHPFVLCVFSSGLPDEKRGEDTIAEIGLRFYKHVARESPGSAPPRDGL